MLMRCIRIVVAVAVVAFGTSGVARGAIVTLDSVADTWVSNYEAGDGDFGPNQNYGDDPTMRVGAPDYGESPPEEHRALIRFDVPGGWDVDSAFLHLTGFGSTSELLTVGAHGIAEDWGEYTVTWNNKPAVDSDVEATADLSGAGSYSWDLTSLVQAWSHDPASNFGVALYDHGTQYFKHLYTREHSVEASRPKLEITYETSSSGDPPVIPEPASVVIWGVGLVGLAMWAARRRRAR